MVDHHDKNIMKSFDLRPENTGAALFFDKEDLKTLVIVLRMKYFEEEKDNGLIMFVVEDLFRKHKAVEDLAIIINKSFKKDKHLRESILKSIEQKVLKSIDKNA